jgi:tetratricopeptide (TPR) repeat protein
MNGTDELEAEREFLLRSLDDLESERDAGNIDDETYRTLHEDYTARAATVIRSLRDGVAPVLPEAPRSSRRMKVLTFIGIAAFAGFAAFGLTRALGTREPGQTITGNADANKSERSTLKSAAAANPDSYDARIAYARALLGTDLASALREYDAASRIDPKQPEPFTYIGWINALAAQQLEAGAQRDAVAQRALTSLNQAITLNPNYFDAYVFRGLTHMNVLADPAAAIPDFQQFLALAPQDHPQRALVTGALTEAIAATTPTTVAAP